MDKAINQKDYNYQVFLIISIHIRPWEQDIRMEILIGHFVGFESKIPQYWSLLDETRTNHVIR